MFIAFTNLGQQRNIDFEDLESLTRNDLNLKYTAYFSLQTGRFGTFKSNKKLT